jgi:6,7-dimethyl-8-ribityllumazine synthase
MVKQLSGLPKLELSDMMPVLLGMLGLGTMRSVEKVNGVEEHK